MMGRSRTDGEARRTTAHRGSAGSPVTLRRIWAVVWTCWDAHSVRVNPPQVRQRFPQGIVRSQLIATIVKSGKKLG